MQILYKIEKIIFSIELTAIVILLLSLACFAFSQVITRNFFAFSIHWMSVYNGIALLVLTMLGASVAASSFERSHINIDLFQGILRFPYNKYLGVVLSMVSCLACILFFYIAFDYVAGTRTVGKIVSVINIPEWVIAMIFPVCFLSMAYKFFLCALNDFFSLKKGAPESGNSC